MTRMDIMHFTNGVGSSTTVLTGANVIDIDKVKQIDSAIEADPLHCELRILDWILFQVCSNEIKKFERM
jgi:hypothetical protein